MPLERLCVFAGAGDGAHEDYRRAAIALGVALAERRVTLVYGGASVGLMGAIADAVVRGGGAAVGVIPRILVEREVAHGGLSQLHVVDTMHERKALMGELSDAFAALPGGLGTLEELFEVATWKQLGLHAKPIALLNVRGYFDPLAQALDHAVAEGFLAADHRRIVVIENSIEALLEGIEHAARSTTGPWQPTSTAEPRVPRSSTRAS